MRYKNQLNKSLKIYFFYLFFCILIVFIVAGSYSTNSIVTSNINTVKSIESSRILWQEKQLEVEEVEKYQKIDNLDSISSNASNYEFVGTMTGYGPDCIGCSGNLACPPYQNVLNNNIYYNDSTYGTLRIVAADPRIPCGSIVKILNYEEKEFLGIVLDRGKDIQGMTMDLLYESENSPSYLGRRYNIVFQIERLGF